MSNEQAEELKHKPVVFFVDDEDGIRLVVRRLLRARGFDMIGASSAEEAAEVLDRYEGDIDVVLMDIALPDGWGGRVAQRLLAMRPDLAIVYTTGMVEIDPIESGGLTGSDAVLRKPFTGDQLAETLNNAMASKRGRS